MGTLHPLVPTLDIGISDHITKQYGTQNQKHINIFSNSTILALWATQYPKVQVPLARHREKF
jgi:hypothetical protein